METYFYVIGSSLVVIALLVSFIGMRNDNFPSPVMLRIGIAFVAAVVIATAYGAVNASQDEQQQREDEQNREASVTDVQATADNQATGAQDVDGEQAPGDRSTNDTSSGASGTAPASGDPAAGAQVFTDQSCGGCHTLKAAHSTGNVGPDLDAALASKDTAFIEESIVDPNAEVEKGFGPNIMPQDFGSVLSPTDLANLVAFVAQSTGAKTTSASGGSSSSSKGSGSSGG